MMKKYPIYLQDEEKACGAYCILMIFKYYGLQEEIKVIKKKARLNQNGITMKGIIECFKDYQIEAHGYEATIQDIVTQVKLPCILYMVYEGIGHFVVLYEMNNGEYVIGDPARGLIDIYEEEMKQHFANRVVTITHIGRTPQMNYHSYFQFLKETFVSYQQQMKSLLIRGMKISLLGYMSSYFFQIFVDDIHVKTPYFYIVVLCITYCVIELMRVKLNKMKGEQCIELKKTMDEECVFSSTMNMIEMPYSFFYQEKGNIQGQLLSLFEMSEMTLACFEHLFLDGVSLVVFILGMFIMNWKMTCVVLVMMSMLTILCYRSLKIVQNLHQQELETSLSFQHHLLELIENHFLIYQFLLLQKQRERSYRIYSEYALSQEKKKRYLLAMQSKLQYIIYVFYGMILLLGFYLFGHQKITMGQLMMFYMLVSYSIDPLVQLITLAGEYKQVEMIYEKYKIFEKEKAPSLVHFDEKITSITLDDVTFAYGYQRPLLEHIDLHIDHHFILKGKTGSGKSTLLKLIMGYDANYSGDIYINEHELRTLDLHSYYQHIGYTNETPTFLHMTLFENFLCSDAQKIEKYLKAFGQLALIDMYHITLNEDGAPLSLGQRQVVALIRLLLQEKDVYVLDEAFSHMDSRLASKIMRYLIKNGDEKIYIFVNHQTKLVNKNLGCAIIEEGKLKSEG